MDDEGRRVGVGTVLAVGPCEAFEHNIDATHCVVSFNKSESLTSVAVAQSLIVGVVCARSFDDRSGWRIEDDKPHQQ